MDEAKRKELRELCDKATPGPWEQSHAGTGRNGKFIIDEYFVRASEPDDVSVAADIIDPVSGQPSEANAAFIAAARTSVPALLDALEASEADVAELRALDAEAKVGADEQTKQLRALQSENAALRSRLERVETKAGRLLSAKDRLTLNEDHWDALRAALESE